MPHTLHHFARRYRVEGVLGRGGMGVVLHARDDYDGREVAIKVLKPSLAEHPIVWARFAREAEILARLRSDHVVRSYGEGVSDGLPYLVMERLHGADLADLISERGALPMHAAVGLARQLCAALRDVHEAGIVHRDLKPENVFIAREGNCSTVKLIDFGIAKADDDEPMLSEDDAAMGTTGYMAPEQFDAPHSVDGRADIWALGVILYELLTGRRPFEGNTRSQIIAQVLCEQPVPPSAWAPHLPPAIDALVMGCLQRDRDDRHASVDELDAALAPLTLASVRRVPRNSRVGRRAEARTWPARRIEVA
jgi:eukaryotic-like serine/threonine-protein kinase